MGKTSGEQTTSTKYTLSPEQQTIMQNMMSQYLPGGQAPTSAPKFDFNSNSQLQDYANNYVAPVSQPQQQAINLTEQNVGSQTPTMDAAKGLTVAGATPVGQQQGNADGWSTGADGKAQYQDYSTGINKYMSPFVGNVINTGLGFMDLARQRANLQTDNDSVSAGSFGGTRQAVEKGVNDMGFAAQAENLVSTNLNTAYNNAQSQYNTGFGQGQQALGYNTSVDQANRTAALASGAQLGNQAGQAQQLAGNDINALANAGGIIQQEDQARRDASRAAQMQDQTYGLNVAQAVSGFTPPPSSTSTSTQSTPSSSIWGSAVGAGLGALAMFSDKEAKEGVKDVDPEDSLKEIRSLKPKKFQYTDFAQSHGAPGGEHRGFMAQHLEHATGEHAPVHGASGLKQVDIVDHIGRLTHAVQALDAKMAKKYGGREARA